MECIEESLTHDENVVSHITRVLESECLEYEWNISKLPYALKKSVKCCRPTQASMQGKSGEEKTWHTQPKEVRRSFVLTTMYRHNFGLA